MEKKQLLNIIRVITCLFSCLSCPAGKSYHFCTISVVICGPPRSTTFFHIISQTAKFSKKKVIEYKMCLLLFSTTGVWNIAHPKKN